MGVNDRIGDYEYGQVPPPSGLDGPIYDYEVQRMMRDNGYTRDADRPLILWRDLFLTISLIFNFLIVMYLLIRA